MELAAILKNSCLIFLSIYIYVKILNIKNTKMSFWCSVPICILTGVATAYVNSIVQGFSLIIVAISAFIYCKIAFHKSMYIHFSASIIATGVCYSLLGLATILLLPVEYILIKLCNISNITIITIFIMPFEFILIYFLFKIKRFQKGIPNFEHSFVSEFGVLISVLVLMIGVIIPQDMEMNVFLFIYVLLILSSIVFLIGYRKHIDYIYTKKIQERNLKLLDETIKQKTDEITYLKEQLESQSKLIHKDNKIIPAMELAVREFCNNPDTEKGNVLLTQLDCMVSERKGILKNVENTKRTSIQSGIFSLDIVLNYLFSRCETVGIYFQFSCMENVQKFLECIIDIHDLNTLLVDLGENAIIAINGETSKNLKIDMGRKKEAYYVNLFDTGSPFDARVIYNMGYSRYTTHASTGGTGIGLMTTLEILRKYNASFEIEELEKSSSYTKRIGFIFDNCNEIRIKSKRRDIILATKSREDILLI